MVYGCWQSRLHQGVAICNAKEQNKCVTSKRGTQACQLRLQLLSHEAHGLHRWHPQIQYYIIMPNLALSCSSLPSLDTYLQGILAMKTRSATLLYAPGQACECTALLRSCDDSNA